MAKASELKWGSVERYVKSIAMVSEVDIARLKEVFLQARVLCPENLKDIFISNYKEADGKDRFKDLWLFSDHHVLEVLNFSIQEKPKLEMTAFANNIAFLSVEAEDMDLSRPAKDTSKLHLEFLTPNGFSCDQIALGSNCDKLMDIFKTYLKHNLSTGQSSDML